VHEVQIDEILVPTTQVPIKFGHCSGFPERYNVSSAILVSSIPTGMDLMAFPCKYTFTSAGLLFKNPTGGTEVILFLFKATSTSAGLLSNIPTGILLMRLSFKYKYLSAGLLSTIPTGTEVMALFFKFRTIINVSPLNSFTGMKEISLLLK